MQTRSYDCYIEVTDIKGYRQVNEDFTAVILDQETNCYTNLYVDNIAVSFLHSMEEEQLNAIHFFEDNQGVIISVITDYLAKTFKNPKQELGLDCINILNEHEDAICYVTYRFIDVSGNKYLIKLHREKVVEFKVL